MRFRLPIHYLLFSACCGVSIKATTDWHFSGVNIAYGKTATQGPDTYSQTLSSGTKNFPADLAVDGNNSTKFQDGSCTHTTGLSSTDAFWTLELQKGYKITGIVIYNMERNDMRNRLKNFIIYGNESVVLHNSTGTSKYKESVIYIPLNETRYFSSITVKLPANKGFSASGYYYLALCEVEIYAATCRYLHITNGEMTPNQTLYEVNTQARIVCNEGFEPTEQKINCSNNKTWTYYKPCSLVYCAYPGKPINGDYLNFQNKTIYSQSSLPYGSVITVKCDLGYRSENTEKSICQFDGTWSGEAPVCTKVQCSYPVDIANCEYQLQNGSKYESGPSYYNTTVHVICNNGYKINGNKERTCNANQTWSGEAPVCTKVQCSYPVDIANGEYQLQNGSKYESGPSYYNTTVHVICNDGYKINGNKERTCNANQTWSGETICDKVTCFLPEMPEGGFYGVKTSSGSFFPYHNTIYYSYEIHAGCPKGYFLNLTSSVRKCLATGIWSGEQGKCVLVTCTQPEEIKNGFYNYTKELPSERVPYNTILTTVCDENFELVNPEYRRRRCTEAGVWDKEHAYCVKMQPHTETSKAGLIGGTVSAAGLIISASLVALLIICRRRKRNLKDQEESLTYTSLRKSQIGPSSSDYAELNITGLEDGISSKGEMPSGSEHAVYCNTTTEL